MYKVIRGFDELELRTDINLTDPAQGVKGNCLRLRREPLKSKTKNNCAQSVTQIHSFFTNRVVPCWNKLTAPSLAAFKSVLLGLT